MKTKHLIIPSIALLGAAIAGSFGANAIVANAEGEEQTTSEEIVSQETIESSSEAATKETEFAFIINEAHIGYRDSEDASYADGDSKIGNYYLSADGWRIDEEEPIIMTIKGNVTTKLDNKIVYIYEYKPTLVKFNNVEIKANEDKTYTLARPEEAGTYDLAIYFTKTIVLNPLDLTSLNWSSFLTVSNLMTIVSWAVIVIGIIAVFAINQKYRTRGSTTLQEVKNQLSAQIENQFGETVAKQVNELLDVVVKKAFDSINEKLDSTNNNMTTLMRCLLVMQENTPEARLAVTKYLSELDKSSDEQAQQVKAIIEAEMEKYKNEQLSKRKALEEAQKSNAQWKDKVSDKQDKDDVGGFGSL